MKQEEELTRRIKAVFEDVDDGLSENGWAELRKKYPAVPSRKLPIWWISGIAASILLVAGLFLFDKKAPQITEEPGTIVKSNPKKENNPITTTSPIATNPQVDQVKTIKTPELNSQTADNVIKEGGIPSGQKFVIAHQAPIVSKENQIVPSSISNAVVKIDSPIKSAVVPNQVVIANQPVTPAVIEPKSNTNNEVKAPKQTTEEFLKKQSELLMANNTKKEEKGVDIKNSLDVFTGTFVNYYANNTAKINAGFGVNANIRVGQGVFLSFGAGLSQNRISYNNSSRIPEQLASDVASSATAYNVVSAESKISDIKVNAQLLSIDIPITVKFYPGKKKNFYLATGINSNSYLLQRYTYDYTVQNSTGFVKSVPIQEQTEESQFKGFDFANSAIIAVGISQNIGKNTIIFEPYFKPTIGSMGEKNLKINTAGINLRFNFTGKKK